MLQISDTDILTKIKREADHNFLYFSKKAGVLEYIFLTYVDKIRSVLASHPETKVSPKSSFFFNNLHGEKGIFTFTYLQSRNAFRVSILTWMWSEIGVTALIFFPMWIHSWSWTCFCRYSLDISAPSQTAVCVFLAIMITPWSRTIRFSSTPAVVDQVEQYHTSGDYFFAGKASSKIVSFCRIHTWCKKHIGKSGKPDSAVRADGGICIVDHKSSRRKRWF